MGYLIDTNVLSEIRKGERANAGVREWFAEASDEDLFVSVLTFGEVRRGIEGYVVVTLFLRSILINGLPLYKRDPLNVFWSLPLVSPTVGGD